MRNFAILRGRGAGTVIGCHDCPLSEQGGCPLGACFWVTPATVQGWIARQFEERAAGFASSEPGDAGAALLAAGYRDLAVKVRGLALPVRQDGEG